MKKIAVCMLGCIVLTGCSELQVIGRAAMSELAADTISVENERYRDNTARKARKIESQVLLAKVTMADARVERPERKELWRNN